MFDTHCHLQFSRFKKNVDEVIQRAFDEGIKNIVIPGTDVPTSQKAIEIAEKYEGIYAAVGIHPHHVYEMKINNDESTITNELKKIEELLKHPKVVAVGEIGMDRHEYTQTKYENYAVDEDFIELQRGLLEGQIDLAIKYGKSVIFHNREAKKDVLHIVQKKWSDTLRGHAVFHCCEPDPELLEFAKKHEMYLGVDGDVTYFKEKAEFIKTVPLDMLVLETDAPFLLPEPYRTQKLFPNEPKHIKYIAEYIAKLKGITVEELVFHTTKNAFKLFNVSTTA